MLFQDLADVVKVGEERVLLPVPDHPFGDERSAARDDLGDPPLYFG